MKKALSLLLASALALSFASVAAFAADTNFALASLAIYDEDGTTDDLVKESVTRDSDTSLTIDDARPSQTYYIYLGTSGTDDFTVSSSSSGVDIKALADTDYFKFKNDKDKNGSLIKSMSVETDINKNSMARADVFLKVTLNDSAMTSEEKITGTVILTSKSADQDSYITGADMSSGEKVEIDYTIWINNTAVGNDDNPDTGDRVYFDPDENDTNTLVWGDDRAALKFESDDDASEFYARLSTKSNSEIYSEYGDPVNADLYFYDFVGNPTVPSTSRATLTLGIPWDDDDDYVPDPEQCYIYEIDADGILTDVTSMFTYSEDDQEIEGWSIKTRTLGTYVVSDTELDIESYEDDEEVVDEAPVDSETTTDSTTSVGKDIPNTGSGDMVNMAVLAGILSLSAAGAAAFRRSIK